MKSTNVEGAAVTPKGNINWGTGVFLVIAHLAAIASLFFFSL
jgi:hypothetical protein